MEYPIQRHLDGVYFRMERDGKWCNVCFSDLTEDERNEVIDGWDVEQLKKMCNIMASYLRTLGDELDVVCE